MRKFFVALVPVAVLSATLLCAQNVEVIHGHGMDINVGAGNHSGNPGAGEGSRPGHTAVAGQPSPSSNSAYPELDQASADYQQASGVYQQAYQRYQNLLTHKANDVSVSPSEDPDDAKMQLEKAQYALNIAWGRLTQAFQRASEKYSREVAAQQAREAAERQAQAAAEQKQQESHREDLRNHGTR
jgi:hypothetical protein